MTKIVRIQDNYKEDFIIEEPDVITIEGTHDKIPNIVLILSLNQDNIQAFSDFLDMEDSNYHALNSIKVISKNLFKYYYEFHECTNIDIRPISMDREAWNVKDFPYTIKFNCLYYDFVRKDTKYKIQRYEPFSIT